MFTDEVTDTTVTRAARKLQTRQALLDAALRLMQRQSLSGLSLREVARGAGIVPAGFYRHFPDLESLGVALTEQCLGGLRTAIRAVRVGRVDSDEIIRRSVRVLAREVRAHREHFAFLARERYGSLPRVRAAIREQLRLSGEELAGDLLAGDVTDVSGLARWDPADLQMLTTLVVNQMVVTAGALLDVPPDRPAAARTVVDTATRQLRLIMLGARCWLDSPGASADGALSSPAPGA
jgi:AcrR family transcriptional regulator